MILQHLLEQILPQHPSFPEFAQQYTGKVCKISLDTWVVFFQIHQGGMLFCSPQTTACEIKMDMAGLFSLMGLTIPEATLSFSGDTEIAAGLKRLFGWQPQQTENILYHLLPDNLATLSVLAIRNGQQVLKHGRKTLKEQIQFQLFDVLGLCADKTSINENYERILALKWQLESLKQEH